MWIQIPPLNQAKGYNGWGAGDGPAHTVVNLK